MNEFEHAILSRHCLKTPKSGNYSPEIPKQPNFSSKLKVFFILYPVLDYEKFKNADSKYDNIFEIAA